MIRGSYALPQDPEARSELYRKLAGKRVLIRSGEHRAWWRADCSGYVTDVAGAGIYQFEDAWAASAHCCPSKQISYVLYEPMVASISDTELLRRAVETSRPRRGHPKWTAVMERFMLGSTYAQQLCRRFEFDPDEVRKR